MEEEIICTALENINHLTGLNGRFIRDNVKNGQLQLEIDGSILELIIEVKN